MIEAKRKFLRYRAGVHRWLDTFVRNEDGMVVVFIVFFLTIMLLITGLALDLIRIETDRVRAQSTLDNAVLAAADLDQTQSPETVVRDYLEKAGLEDYLYNDLVRVDSGLNYREVGAAVEIPIPTLFGDLAQVGIGGGSGGTEYTIDADGKDRYGNDHTYGPTFNVFSASTASERVSKVEISLVVDISGSMQNYDRIGNLRTAATEFVDTVLKDGNEDLISVSLVPYSEQVAIGSDLFGALNINRSNTYNANCIMFSNNDFNSTAVSATAALQQDQYLAWVGFNSSYYPQNNRDYPVCPTQSWAQIKPWSTSRSDLNAQIAQLQPFSQTSIFLGMKWGVALLDPAFKQTLSTLVSSGKVDSDINGRPAAYDDKETLKVVILMTDGVNTSSYRIRSNYYGSNTWKQRWYDYNTIHYIRYYQNTTNYFNYIYEYSNTSTGNTLLSNICDAAKAQGIVIWTIGFETDSDGSQVMSDCASTPSHFFDVEGIEISDAFRSIASQINNLKLVR